MNSNHTYLAFDQEIDRCKNWLQSKALNACGYSAEVLLDRLMQRIVEISLSPYVLLVSRTWTANLNCLPLPGTQMHCGRASMKIGTGKLTVGISQLVANHLEFFFHWAYCLLAMLGARHATTKDIPAVLIFGVGEESLFVDKNDQRFVRYCRLGPIEPLRNGKRFIVQSMSNIASSCQPDFSYFRNPLIKLMHETKMTAFERLQLLVKHLVLFFAYLSAVFRFPPLSLLGMDFAYSSISRELDRRGLIKAIVLTTSNYTRQALWVRELHFARVHMVSYSQNWKPIIYSADRLESDVPNLRWIRVDMHWVWTRAFADYLRNLGHYGAVEVVGPIVWYLPEIEAPKINEIEIVIFDVPAVSDKVMLSVGELTNYYHPRNLSSFVKDIVSLKVAIENTFDLPVRFRLKTKRGYTSGYDRAYYEQLQQLGAMGVLSLEHHSTNLYSLISSSHLVIAYPFTSPATLADSLKVPSIYYDPTGAIVEHSFNDAPSSASFADSPQSLFDVAVSILSKVFSISPTARPRTVGLLH